MRYLCGTCALALLFTGCVTAAAAEITRTPEANGLDVITIRGNIEADDHKKFIDIAFDIMQASVILDSRGGYVEAALAIGRFIRLRNYETRVHNGAVCNSACTFIWLAGTFRHLDPRARLGFHSVSKQGKPPYERSEPGNARVAAYLAVMGVPQQVIDLQPKADPCCINYIDHAQAKAWALLSDRPAKQQQALPTPETQQAPATTAPASPKLDILRVRPVTTLSDPVPQQAPATSAPVRGEQPAAPTVSTVDRQPASTSNALIEWWRPTDFTHRRIPDLWQSAKPVPSPAPAAKVEEPPIAARPKITNRIEPGGQQAPATSTGSWRVELPYGGKKQRRHKSPCAPVRPGTRSRGARRGSPQAEQRKILAYADKTRAAESPTISDPKVPRWGELGAMRNLQIAGVVTAMAILASTAMAILSSSAWAQSRPSAQQGVAWLYCPVGTKHYGKVALRDIRACNGPPSTWPRSPRRGAFRPQ